MDYECSANLQVPLLLKLGEDRPALVKAIESGNTDLVYTVLLHLRENMPLGEFQVPWRWTTRVSAGILLWFLILYTHYICLCFKLF
jgi:hypothetical protein